MKIEDTNLLLLQTLVKEYIKEAPTSNERDSQVKDIAKSVINHLKHTTTKDHPTILSAWKTKKLTKEELANTLEAILPKILHSHSPWRQTKSIEETATATQKLVLGLLRGESLNMQEIKNKKALFKAVVWKKDEAILDQAKQLIRQVFSEMFTEINSKTLSSEESFHMEIVVGELLALVPFLRPIDGDALQVPMQIDGKWQLINYEVERIELTPKAFGSPLVAYGLKPQINDKKAPPLLLFKGTTYPSDEGFGLSLLTDLNPFASVGSYAFKIGKNKIKAFLDAQVEKTGQKSIIYGKSLGGALAWKTALDFSYHVSKVMAYGSPGFSEKALAKLKQLDKLPEEYKPAFNFFCQKNDPVPFFGKEAPAGVKYYEILGRKSRKGVMAHADMFSTHKDSVVIKLQPSQMAQRWRRRGLNVLRLIVTLLVFHLLATAYTWYAGIKHLGRLADKHQIRPLWDHEGKRKQSHV